MFYTLLCALLPFGFTATSVTLAPTEPAAIEWLTWEEAARRNATTPKPFLVDIYTDWCGWCKHMDKTTFRDSAVVAYVQQHFYAVKVNAEQTQDVVFNDYTFRYMKQENGRGVHELAFSLLEGKMSYPSFAYLTPQYHRVLISPGFKQPAQVLLELRYIAEQRYANTPWEQYAKEAGQ